jgi:hypothetical protein
MIAYYRVGANNQQSPGLIKVEPPNLNKFRLPDFAAEISPQFVSIYYEASEAKERGLSQIAGPAYRKAFEFLIKDYAKTKVHSEEDRTKIETSFAGKVVKDFIADRRVQVVAERSLWIGNDETHYLRKWETKNINDLITLISLTLHWIEIERQSESYLNEMPNP